VSEFTVVASALYDHAARLSSFSGEIDAVRGRVAGGSSAAARTPASEAVEHFSGHIGARLVDFGAAADALHGAISGAGAAYVRVDACVRESSR
jgi:hypothetical protein